MSTPESCNSRIARFTELYNAVRGIPVVAQRVQSFIAGRTGGKKLHEFLANGATEEAKIALLDELNDILESKDYTKFPEAPKGQAAPTGEVPAAEPVVTFTKAKLIPVRAPNGGTAIVTEPVVEEPAVAVVQPEPPKAAPCKLIPAGAPSVGQQYPVVEERPAVAAQPVTADPAAQLAALLRQMMPPPPAPAAPSLTEAQVCAIVRTELAKVFETLADALRTAK